MGTPKALLRLGDQTFARRIVAVLGQLGSAPPIVVLGRHAPVIAPDLTGLAVRVVTNPNPDQGQLSSLQLALRHVGPCRGCLVWPVDQPAVTLEVVRGLVTLFRPEPGPLIVMPECTGRRGHPAIFGAALFPELLGIPPGHGPKELIRAHEADITLLHTDDTATIDDVDTPADYERLVRKWESRLRAPG